MRLLLAACCSFLLAAPGWGQDEPEIYEIVEQQPELIGGLEDLQRRVEYPELARRAGVEGMVFIQFVVDERGLVSQAVCARSPNQLLCDAAIQAVRESRFRPGMQRGRPVKVRYTLPVRFTLRDADDPLPPFTFFLGMMGERWNPELAQRRVGPPRSGVVKDGNGTLAYAGTESGAYRVAATITDGVVTRMEARFVGDEGLRSVEDAYQTFAGDFGPPEDGGAFSPSQLGEPIRILILPERGLFQVEFVPVAADYERAVIPQETLEAAGIDAPPVPPATEPEIFMVVEQDPELIGGLDGLQARVRRPVEAAGVRGTVYVQFTVTPEGRVTDAVCARTSDERLCAPAIAAVEASEFRPGMQRGRPVFVRYTLPVRFP